LNTLSLDAERGRPRSLARGRKLRRIPAQDQPNFFPNERNRMRSQEFYGSVGGFSMSTLGWRQACCAVCRDAGGRRALRAASRRVHAIPGLLSLSNPVKVPHEP
jgi:hypothetical protein